MNIAKAEEANLAFPSLFFLCGLFRETQTLERDYQRETKSVQSPQFEPRFCNLVLKPSFRCVEGSETVASFHVLVFSSLNVLIDKRGRFGTRVEWHKTRW